jgi:6-phosphogluconate dehydrogenase
LDKAGSKGTGKWTSEDGLEQGIPIPSIDAAVSARNISALKAERQMASCYIRSTSVKLPVDKKAFIQELEEALYAGMLLCYGQGFSLMQQASKTYDMQIPLPKVVRVWRGGCIIRSSMLEIFIGLFDKHPSLTNILLNENIAAILTPK